jgi:Domain of unknown function (DUF1772)
MLLALQVVTLTLVSIAMALALAHALELPGKMQLSEDDYRTVQTIYYPGFTLGGIGEGLGLVALLALLFVTPSGTAAFWLTLAAFVALAAMHGTYWLLTHPVNRFWVENIDMGKAGSRFFGVRAAGQTQARGAADWKALRDRWEYSHVVRAVLGLSSQSLLVVAIAL